MSKIVEIFLGSWDDNNDFKVEQFFDHVFALNRDQFSDEFQIGWDTLCFIHQSAVSINMRGATFGACFETALRTARMSHPRYSYLTWCLYWVVTANNFFPNPNDCWMLLRRLVSIIERFIYWSADEEQQVLAPTLSSLPPITSSPADWMVVLHDSVLQMCTVSSLPAFFRHFEEQRETHPDIYAYLMCSNPQLFRKAGAREGMVAAEAMQDPEWHKWARNLVWLILENVAIVKDSGVVQENEFVQNVNVRDVFQCVAVGYMNIAWLLLAKLS